MTPLGTTTIQGAFSYAKYQIRVPEILARYVWNDGNRGVFGSIVLIGFGSFAYYFLFHYGANSELWDTIMRIWNMIYAVYNGEAMDGMSEALGQEALSEKPKE